MINVEIIPVSLKEKCKKPLTKKQVLALKNEDNKSMLATLKELGLAATTGPRPN